MSVLVSGLVPVLSFSSSPNSKEINELQTLLKIILLSYCSEESQVKPEDVSDYNHFSCKILWFHEFVKQSYLTLLLYF